MACRLLEPFSVISMRLLRLIKKLIIDFWNNLYAMLIFLYWFMSRMFHTSESCFWISASSDKGTNLCHHQQPPTTTQHHPLPHTTIHRHPATAKVFPPPLTTTHHQPKYIHYHPPLPTYIQNISTTTHHNLKYVQVRTCFIREILSFFIQK